MSSRSPPHAQPTPRRSKYFGWIALPSRRAPWPVRRTVIITDAYGVAFEGPVPAMVLQGLPEPGRQAGPPSPAARLPSDVGRSRRVPGDRSRCRRLARCEEDRARCGSARCRSIPCARSGSSRPRGPINAGKCQARSRTDRCARSPVPADHAPGQIPSASRRPASLRRRRTARLSSAATHRRCRCRTCQHEERPVLWYQPGPKML